MPKPKKPARGKLPRKQRVLRDDAFQQEKSSVSNNLEAITALISQTNKIAVGLSRSHEGEFKMSILDVPKINTTVDTLVTGSRDIDGQAVWREHRALQSTWGAQSKPFDLVEFSGTAEAMSDLVWPSKLRDEVERLCGDEMAAHKDALAQKTNRSEERLKSLHRWLVKTTGLVDSAWKKFMPQLGLTNALAGEDFGADRSDMNEEQAREVAIEGLSLTLAYSYAQQYTETQKTLTELRDKLGKELGFDVAESNETSNLETKSRQQADLASDTFVTLVDPILCQQGIGDLYESFADFLEVRRFLKDFEGPGVFRRLQSHLERRMRESKPFTEAQLEEEAAMSGPRTEKQRQLESIFLRLKNDKLAAHSDCQDSHDDPPQGDFDDPANYWNTLSLKEKQPLVSQLSAEYIQMCQKHDHPGKEGSSEAVQYSVLPSPISVKKGKRPRGEPSTLRALTSLFSQKAFQTVFAGEATVAIPSWRTHERRMFGERRFPKPSSVGSGGMSDTRAAHQARMIELFKTSTPKITAIPTASAELWKKFGKLQASTVNQPSVAENERQDSEIASSTDEASHIETAIPEDVAEGVATPDDLIDPSHVDDSGEGEAPSPSVLYPMQALDSWLAEEDLVKPPLDRPKAASVYQLTDVEGEDETDQTRNQHVELKRRGSLPTLRGELERSDIPI